jgi:hypothetical protein
METIGTNLSKLSKALAGVDDEGADASKALQFLGITAKDSGGNLRDPAEVLNDVALKLAQFEDGAGKTALAMDLFGKSGASMLPFLKDLAENQNLNIRLTAQQIEEADQSLQSRSARMRAESSFVSQTLVTSAIPALSVLSEELKKILLGTEQTPSPVSASCVTMAPWPSGQRPRPMRSRCWWIACVRFFKGSSRSLAASRRFGLTSSWPGASSPAGVPASAHGG